MVRIMDEADALDERGEEAANSLRRRDPCKSYSCGWNETCSRPSKDERLGDLNVL